MRYSVALAALAATLVAASPAAAASTATAQALAKGTVLKSLSLTWVSDLDFGVVAADATNPGWVNIDADSGAQTTDGSAVVALTGASSRAEFDGLGDPNATVQLQLQQPNSGVICSGTGCAYSMPAALTLDKAGATTRTTDSAGKFVVFVGGKFNVAAAQQNGLYSAQFNLTAVYP